MKFITLAACAALVSLVALVSFKQSQSQAQVGEAHFRAWDRVDSQSTRATKRATRRSARASREYRTRQARRDRAAQRKQIALHKKTAKISARPSPKVAARIIPAVPVPTPAPIKVSEPDESTIVDNITLADKVAENIVKHTIEVAQTIVMSPFGVLINLFAHRSGIPNEVGSFLSKVQRECGKVTVISTLRRGSRVAGSRRMSCHAIGQAVDYQVVDPSCALRLARTVRLGHSIDYYGVRALYGRGMPVHYHVSNCRQEMGAKFAHGGGRIYSKTRLARNSVKKTRYAKTWKNRHAKRYYRRVRTAAYG